MVASGPMRLITRSLSKVWVICPTVAFTSTIFARAASASVDSTAPSSGIAFGTSVRCWLRAARRVLRWDREVNRRRALRGGHVERQRDGPAAGEVARQLDPERGRVVSHCVDGDVDVSRGVVGHRDSRRRRGEDGANPADEVVAAVVQALGEVEPLPGLEPAVAVADLRGVRLVASEDRGSGGRSGVGDDEGVVLVGGVGVPGHAVAGDVGAGDVDRERAADPGREEHVLDVVAGVGGAAGDRVAAREHVAQVACARRRAPPGRGR